MTHMVCAYPDFEESQKIFDILKEKSSYIEIQFPFSDPIADWPVIEQANHKVLENGVKIDDCFKFVKKNITKTPKILIMTYYNIVYNYWVEKFVEKASKIWVWGLIIPDVPFDENDGKMFREICKKYDVVFTEIVSPLTTSQRLNQIKNLNPKLIYAISQNMTTGSKAKFWKEFEEYIKNLKSIFLSPFGREYPKGERGLAIWVWFGVKTKQDVEKVCNIADFAIIWSEFIKKYNEGWIDKIKNYLKEITK